jgi:hypothetical protein
MATAVITDYPHNKTISIYPVDYGRVEITPSVHSAVFMDVLPFRVRFSTIQIESVASNIPAIPFQIIGYSNYIL